MTNHIASKMSAEHLTQAQWHRRQLIQSLAMVCSIGSLMSCSSQPRQFLLGHNNFTPYLFFEIAQQRGYFSSDEVKTIVMPSATHVAQALASGTIDAGLLTLDEVYRLRLRKFELDIVLILDVSDGIDVVLARPEISDIKDIRGKKIAVEVGAVGNVMLNNLLNAAGLSHNDVEVIYANFGQHKAKYVSGEVDVVITFSPISLDIIDIGANVIFSSKTASPKILDVMAVNRYHSDEFAAVIKKLVKGFLNTVETYEASATSTLEPLALLNQWSVPYTQMIMSDVAMQNTRANRIWLNPPVSDLQKNVDGLAVVLQLSTTDLTPYITNRYLP